MKPAFRIALGVIAGYVTLLFLAPATTFLFHSLWPATAQPEPPALYVWIDLAYSLLYTGVGAFVAAWVGRSIVPALLLGGLFAILGVVTLLLDLDPQHETLYEVLIALCSFPVAWAGGRLWQRFDTNRNTPSP